MGELFFFSNSLIPVTAKLSVSSYRAKITSI